MPEMMITKNDFKLSRRDVLLSTIQGAVAASLPLSVIAEAAPPSTHELEPEFVPENDYPFFGGDLPEAYVHAHAREFP